VDIELVRLAGSSVSAVALVLTVDIEIASLHLA